MAAAGATDRLLGWIEPRGGLFTTNMREWGRVINDNDSDTDKRVSQDGCDGRVVRNCFAVRY